MTQQIKYKRISRSEFLEGNQMRKRILSVCYQLGWAKYNERFGKNTVDFERLDAFLCSDKGLFSKPLNFHTTKELNKVVSQFDNMLKKHLKTN